MKGTLLLAAGLLCGAALFLTGCAAPSGDTPVVTETEDTGVSDPVSGVNGADYHSFEFEDGTVMYCAFWDPGFAQEGGEQLECDTVVP
jgi:hypothetical protein